MKVLTSRLFYDADLIANLEEKQKEKQIDPDRLKKLMDTAFLTPSGRKTCGKSTV